MISGMNNYNGKGRPYGGVGWIVSKKLEKNYSVRLHTKRITSLEIGNLTLIGVYLTANNSKNESMIEHIIDIKDLETLIDELDKKNKEYIIVGDFNSDPIRNKKFDRELTSFLSKRNLKCLEKEFDNFEYTYSNDQHKSFIDHIVTTIETSNRVLNATIIRPDPLNQSDHLPLKVKIKVNINKEKIDDKKSVQLKKKVDWKNSFIQREYANKLEQEIQKNRLIEKVYQDPIGKRRLDEIINTLHRIMINCSDKMVNKSNEYKYKRKSKEWWDEKLEKTHTDMKQELWNYKASGFKDMKIKKRYKRLKQEFRNQQRKNLKEENTKFVKSLNECKNHINFWKLIKKKRKKKVNCEIEMKNLRNLFYDNFNKRIMEQNDKNDRKLDEEITKFESEIGKKNEEEIVIDRNDIKKIIEMLPNGKSSGFSEASNEMFKYGASNTLIHLISALMEKIINSGIIPSFFNVGKISPIIKDPNKCKSDYNNVRPITVSDTLTNIYEKIVLIELNKTHCGSPNQFGFASKSSCNHAVFALKETILNRIKKNKAVYAVAIDASKAFDKINRKNLFHTLIGKIKPLIWRSLKNYYGCSLAYVEKEGEISEIFKTTIGVKQGGPLSPKLFAIYIEELVELVEKENLGIKIQDLQIGIILYADDIIIMSDDEKRIQRALEICEEFGSKKEIKFNPEKTQLIVFGNKRQRNKKVSLMMNKKMIETHDKIKYLGVLINSKNTNEDHIQQRIRNTVKSLNAIGALGINDKILKTKIKVQLYKTYCRPILSYGCEALKINQLDQRKLKTTEGTIIKRIMGLGKRARTTKLMHALDMETTEMMLLRRKLYFMKRLMINKFTRELVTSLLKESRQNGKNTNKKSVLNELHEILVNENEGIENLEDLEDKINFKIKEISLNNRECKKDGIVESIKFCIAGSMTKEKQEKILQLLTKAL